MGSVGRIVLLGVASVTLLTLPGQAWGQSSGTGSTRYARDQGKGAGPPARQVLAGLFAQLKGEQKCGVDMGGLLSIAQDHYLRNGFEHTVGDHAERSFVIETKAQRDHSYWRFYKFKLVLTRCRKSTCSYEYETYRWSALAERGAAWRDWAKPEDDRVSLELKKLIVSKIKGGICLDEVS